MPYHLELGSDGHSFKGKAIVVSSMTGRHHSLEPLPMAKAKAQKRVLEAAESGEHHSDPDPKKFAQRVTESPKFRKGLFTKEAAREDMKPLEFMDQVLKHPEEYPLGTRRRAQFLKNIQRK